MDTFAKEGLRTLLIIERIMDEDEYAAWSAEYTAALNSISDREAKVD